MAIDQKPEKKSESTKPEPLVFRDNEEVKEKIAAYKKANPKDAVYYSRLVREHPERATDTFILREVQQHEREMKLIMKQMPAAKAFYASQTPEARARIDADVERVNPYYKDREFVQAFFREKDRQARREATQSGVATAPQTAPAKAGAKAAA
jgi:hypothetical protein